jgi:hypothetical protein
MIKAVRATQDKSPRDRKQKRIVLLWGGHALHISRREATRLRRQLTRLTRKEAK